MLKLTDRNNILNTLNNLLNKYEMIFVLEADNPDLKDISGRFCDYAATSGKTEKALIMGPEDWCDTEGIAYKIISLEDYREICELYNLYEFSNRIRFLSDSPRYASMLNYLKSGILEEEEMFQALFT